MCHGNLIKFCPVFPVHSLSLALFPNLHLHYETSEMQSASLILKYVTEPDPYLMKMSLCVLLEQK